MAKLKLTKNEQIKAAEVDLTGLHGEYIGVISRDDALEMAREAKVDLICDSLFSSPPPCRLVSRDAALREKTQAKREEKLREQPSKVKEIRLHATIEEHDYDTKLSQASRLLERGNHVQLVVKLKGKEGEKAKVLLERMLLDLVESGKKQSGIQVSGKQVAVQVLPIQ